MEAGGGVLEVTGYSAFPVLGTLVGLQLLAVLLSLLTKPVVTRYVSAAIAALMTWNLFFVSTTSSAQISLTAQRELADKTGVLQDLASSDFLVSSAVSLWSGFFLVAVFLNILALGMVALLLQERSVAPMAKRDRDLPEDLWGDQK
jgi:uncharacterized membrane protein YedE/YeeE